MPSANSTLVFVWTLMPHRVQGSLRGGSRSPVTRLSHKRLANIIDPHRTANGTPTQQARFNSTTPHEIGPLAALHLSKAKLHPLPPPPGLSPLAHTQTHLPHRVTRQKSHRPQYMYPVPPQQPPPVNPTALPQQLPPVNPTAQPQPTNPTAHHNSHHQ